MYELVEGQLFKIEEIETSTQNAIVRTHFSSVVGYDSSDPITFERIPDREEQTDKIATLHYTTDGELLWVYEYPTNSINAKVESLEQENVELKLALAEMAEAHEQEKTEMQLALAELAELVGGEPNHG